jgi:hypothetical protein
MGCLLTYVVAISVQISVCPEDAREQRISWEQHVRYQLIFQISISMLNE